VGLDIICWKNGKEEAKESTMPECEVASKYGVQYGHSGVLYSTPETLGRGFAPILNPAECKYLSERTDSHPIDIEASLSSA
jgi:hypothetical protein